MHRVRVEHPRHDLLVRVHIRRRDVFVRPEHVEQIGGVPARQSLELRRAQLFRIAHDSSFRPPKRKVHEGALPGHPGGQGLYLVERHVWGEPDTPFARAENVVVNDAISLKHFDASRIHLDGDRRHVHPCRATEVLVESWGELQDFGGDVEPLHHGLERSVAINWGRLAVRCALLDIEFEGHRIKNGIQQQPRGATERASPSRRWDALKSGFLPVKAGLILARMRVNDQQRSRLPR